MHRESQLKKRRPGRSRTSRRIQRPFPAAAAGAVALVVALAWSTVPASASVALEDSRPQDSQPEDGQAQVSDTQQQVSDAQQKAVTDRAVGRIRSPFCPGLMLEVCPTPDASALRDTIGALAATGVTADSIVSLIVAQYGEEYRGYPQAEGRGWLAWLVPPAFILFGILAVAAALRRLRRTGAEREVPVTEADEEEVRRALRALEEAEGSVF